MLACKVVLLFGVFLDFSSLIFKNWVIMFEDLVILSQKEVGVLLTPPSGIVKAENWAGLESEHNLQIKFEDVQRYHYHLDLLYLFFIHILLRQ